MTPIELIRNFLQERTDVDPALVQPDRLLADLQIDSFSLLELIFEFEAQWDVQIPNDAVTPKTVQDLIDLVERFMPEHGDGVA
ncbi:phosphopantetheine-binding protein [Halothiobacillus diazotrophicus]|uniref:Phosphopantetheine-binding protein n=1 Tax=Halothiobacillus diazotrophicus TaxID=1860122 RepID=A0A191ZJK3_9GAMM|nr:phosphopantetheine-binding protein [Halothiobacillus diazotrophicus]ANJ68027.1 phosphopantetheine-binding protein [Halothiobacillus diazotrophicus]